MNAEPDTPEDSGGSESDQFEEIREAAGAVVASLKWLVDAAERVVENPDAFAKAVGNGRSVVEAFVGGFVATNTEDSATSTEGGGESDSYSGESIE